MDFVLGLQQFGTMGIVLLRVVVGIIFLKHGAMKFAMWKMQPTEQMPSNMLKLMRVLSIIEAIAGLALILGLFTQLGAIALSLVMVGAIYFKIVKWKKTFTGDGGWELDLVLLAACVVLLLNGAGVWGIDVPLQ